MYDEVRQIEASTFYEWLNPTQVTLNRSTPSTRTKCCVPIEIRVKRATAYIANVPPAIQGQGGDKATFTLACKLIHGFALLADLALQLIEPRNQTCIPSWTRAELLHKLNQADACEDGQGRRRGYMLEQIEFDTSFLAPFLESKGLPPPLSEDSLSETPNTNNSPSPTTSNAQSLQQIQPPKKSARSFAGIDVSALAKFAQALVDWVVEGLFSADQLTLFGAASKALKTTILIDLAVALATATLFLNVFIVPKRRRVLLITGESNYRAICKRIMRALKVRGLSWGDVQGWLRIEAVEFPSLLSPADRDAITRDVNEWGIEVVIIDPLYRGLQNLDAHRMAEVGDAIIGFVNSCKPASVIISHHITKSSARDFKVPSLEDLSGAGLAESCGNWWLIGRNAPYKYDGVHDLSVTYGGRDEQAGTHRLIFYESTWTFELSSIDELKTQKLREHQLQKQAIASIKLLEAKQEVLRLLQNLHTAKPKSWIEQRTTCSQSDTRKAIASLVDEKKLTFVEYKDNRNRKQLGLLASNHLQLPTR